MFRVWILHQAQPRLTWGSVGLAYGKGPEHDFVDCSRDDYQGSHPARSLFSGKLLILVILSQFFEVSTILTVPNAYSTGDDGNSNIMG